MGRKTQNKRKKDTAYHPEMHARDVNSREIFKNDTLASQFLRNYTNIPLFANVRPEAIKEIYKKILWALLIKMNVPVDEAREMMGEIGGRGMGYLFENMEKMDIQAERRNTQRERERADAAEERASAAEERASAEKERANAEKERANTEKERADAAELEIQRLKKELEKRTNVTEN